MERIAFPLYTRYTADMQEIPMLQMILQNPWAYFALYTLMGLGLGIIAEQIVLRFLLQFAQSTKWEIDDVIVTSAKGRTIIWITLAGLYFGSLSLPIFREHLLFFHHVLIGIAILTITSSVASFIRGMMNIYFQRMFQVFTSTSIVTHIIVLIIYALGMLVLLQTLGVSIMPVLTAFGVGGLAMALALQDTLSNIFAGIHLVLSHKVKPGDYIQLDTGEEGYVRDITWRNTSICGIPNNMIIIPNSKLASVVITNYNQPVQAMSVRVEVGVSYGSDLSHVEKVAVRVAKETMKEVVGDAGEFQPFVRYHTFGDHSINLRVILRVNEFVEKYRIRHVYIKKLHEAFRKEGIEIPFPIRTVYLKK